jgi:hypothetical protein
MPLSDAALDQASKKLDQVELQSFKATPSTIVPFGQSTLSWRVTAPIGVTIKLDGRVVAKTGSQLVRPNETRTFKLTAHSGPLSSDVGQVTVFVNLGACTTIFLDEAEVQATVEAVVAGILAVQPQLNQRAAPFIDVTPAGIVLKLRFTIEVACSRNPDFNVDAVIGLRIEGNSIEPFFKSFDGNLDFSALEDGLNFTIGAFLGFGPQLAIAIAEDNAQSAARRAILEGLSAAIDNLLRATPPGSAPSHLELRDDGIEIRMCPLSGFNRPIRVPLTGLTFVTAKNGSTNGRATSGTTTAANGEAAAGKRWPAKAGKKAGRRRGAK